MLSTLRENLKDLEGLWFFSMAGVIFGLGTYKTGHPLLIVIFVFTLLRIWRLKRAKVFVLTVFLILLAMLSLVLTEQAHKQIKSLPLEGDDYTISLITLPESIRQEPTYLSGRALLYQVKENKEIPPIKVSFFLPLGEDQNHNFDARAGLMNLTGRARFELPSQARNFYVFDYRDYLAHEGIFWSLKVEDLEAITPVDLSQPPPLAWDLYLSHWRAKLLAPFRSIDNIWLVGIHNKLMLNLDSSAYRQSKDLLGGLGVLHYFAISGFHLNFFFRKLSYLFKRLGVVKENVEPLVLFILFLYGYLVAWPIGLIRSLVILVFRWFNRWLKLPLTSLDSLSLICIILVVLHPDYLFQLGFILSFLMTFILYLFDHDPDENLKSLWTNQKVNLICLLYSWPIVLTLTYEWNGGQVITLFIFALFFDACFMPMMIFMTLLILCARSIPLFRFPIQFLSDTALAIWQWMNLEAWLLPLKQVIGYPQNWVMVVLYFIAILAFLWIRKRPRVVFMTTLLVYIFILPFLNGWHFDWRITLIDVGQGDALLVQEPFGQTILLDTGGKVRRSSDKDAYQVETQVDENFGLERLIKPLKALGVKQIDRLIISHPDQDHMANLPLLSENFTISKLYVSSYCQDSLEWQAIIDACRSRQKSIISSQIILPGQVENLGRSEIKVFALSQLPTKESNDTSILFSLKLGGQYFLNMGDLSQEGEKALMREFPNVKGDILKLGHHGSSTSTSHAFIETLKPKIAFISAGENNSYGHPSPETVHRLIMAKIPYWSTKDQGAIQLTYHPIWGWRIKAVIENTSSHK